METGEITKVTQKPTPVITRLRKRRKKLMMLCTYLVKSLGPQVYSQGQTLLIMYVYNNINKLNLLSTIYISIILTKKYPRLTRVCS